jgi:hypothetical protein
LNIEEGVPVAPGIEVAGMRLFGVPFRVDTPRRFSASWEIAARVKSRTLDPGDEVEVEIYLSGHGLPELTKLSGFIPESIFDRSAKSEVATNVTLVGFGGGPDEPVLEVPAWSPHSEALTFGVFTIGLSRGYALPVVIPGPTRNVAAGEQVVNGTAPVVLRWTLPASAPPGDHAVPLILTYVTKDSVQTRAYELAIHIRPWWERPGYQILIVASTVVVFVASFLQISSHL